MTLRSEDEIVASWPAASEPRVSVCCTTFNQAPYVRDALEGFLSQQTNFAFEVLVHDDASTDGTAQVVHDFASRYPRMVRAVLQERNQFSQGRKPLAEFLLPAARGAYIAICEGDDFWNSPDKLQRQVDALDRHPDIDISFHPALLLQAEGPPTVGMNHGSEPKVIPLADVVLGGGEFMPTPSLMLRRQAVHPLPAWFLRAPIGDYFLQVLGARRRGALYLPDAHASYRVQAAGSWSARSAQWTPQQFTAFHDALDDAMACLEEELPAGERGAMVRARYRHRWHAAFTLFSKGDRIHFRRQMERCWQLHPMHDARQWLFYVLRRTPRLLRAVRTVTTRVLG